MDRRNFIKKAGVVTAATAVVSTTIGAPAIMAAPRIRWTANSF